MRSTVVFISEINRAALHADEKQRIARGCFSEQLDTTSPCLLLYIRRAWHSYMCAPPGLHNSSRRVSH